MAAADTYIYPEYRENVAVGNNGAIYPWIRSVTAAEVNGALDVVNDKLILGKAPNNAILVGWKLAMGDFDSGANVTLNLKISDALNGGSTTKTLVSATTVAQSGGIVTESDAATAAIAANLGWQVDNDDYDVYVETAATGGGVQDGIITVVLYFVFP